MAGTDFTTAGLLAAIRAEGRIPDEATDGTDALLLTLADRILARRFVPKVRKAAVDFYTTQDDIDLEAGTAEYRLPERAVTTSVREVVYVDSSGREIPLSPVPLSTRHSYSLAQSSCPSLYALRDDVVILIPTPASSVGSVRVVYEYRPSKLILATAAAKIDTISLFANTNGYDLYQFTATGWDPNTANEPVDVVCGTAPFSVIHRTALYTSNVTPLALYIPEDTRAPVVGDYVCPRGESPIPQLPAELHSTLAAWCAAEYLKTISPDEAKALMDDAKESLDEAVHIMGSRQQGRQQKIKGGSAMRRGSRSVNPFGDWRP